jgi:hypothetical protein
MVADSLHLAIAADADVSTGMGKWGLLALRAGVMRLDSPPSEGIQIRSSPELEPNSTQVPSSVVNSIVRSGLRGSPFSFFVCSFLLVPLVS